MRKLENITIEITSCCNFHCPHCGNHSGEDVHELKPELVFKLIDEAEKMGVKRIGLTGGEPLMNPHLLSYLDYAKGKIPTVSIATNGYLVDEQFVSQLDPNFVKMAISLDGTKDYHDTFRGKGAFDHVMKAVRLLSRAGIEVKIRSVLQKENQDSILKLMDITNTLPIKRHEILPACPIGRAEKISLLSQEEYLRFLKVAIEKVRQMGTPNITYQFKPVFYQEELFLGVDERCREKSLAYRCDAFDTSLEITYDGDIIGCSFVRESVGNIAEVSLAEIWNSEKTRAYYDTIQFQNQLGECRDCPEQGKCNGGCYGNRQVEAGILKKDHYCFVKRRKDYVL